MMFRIFGVNQYFTLLFASNINMTKHFTHKGNYVWTGVCCTRIQKLKQSFKTIFIVCKKEWFRLLFWYILWRFRPFILFSCCCKFVWR